MNELTAIEYTDNHTVINPVDVCDKEKRLIERSKIDRLHQMMTEIVGERGEMDEINDNGLTEELIDSVYIRSLFIPKNKIIVSKIWKIERYWLILYGEVTFKTEMGLQRIKVDPKTPFRKKVPPGSKVALFTHEDTLWFAISKTSAKTIEEAEDDVGTEKYEDCTYPWDLIEENK